MQSRVKTLLCAGAYALRSNGTANVSRGSAARTASIRSIIWTSTRLSYAVMNFGGSKPARRHAADVEQPPQPSDEPASDLPVLEREHLVEADAAAVDRLLENRVQLVGEIGAHGVQPVDRPAGVEPREPQRRALRARRQLVLIRRHCRRAAVDLRGSGRDVLEVLGHVLDVLQLSIGEFGHLDRRFGRDLNERADPLEGRAALSGIGRAL